MEEFIFDDDVDEVGAEVEAHCPKCKADTQHVVVSKYEDEIRRVQCNPCGDVHPYRKPRGESDEEEPAPAVKKKAVKAKPTWDQVMAKHAKKQPKVVSTRRILQRDGGPVAPQVRGRFRHREHRGRQDRGHLQGRQARPGAQPEGADPAVHASGCAAEAAKGKAQRLRQRRLRRRVGDAVRRAPTASWAEKRRPRASRPARAKAAAAKPVKRQAPRPKAGRQGRLPRRQAGAGCQEAQAKAAARTAAKKPTAKAAAKKVKKRR